MSELDQLERVGDARPARSHVVWTAVCSPDDLVPERGAAALVQGEQVALFRLVDGRVLAVQNLDPYSGANVMARGLVGTRGATPTVASPMYKQVFDLTSGACLEPVGKEPVDLRTWPVKVEGGLVLVGSDLAAGRAVGVPAADDVLPDDAMLDDVLPDDVPPAAGERP